jgi:hypothetical protein
LTKEYQILYSSCTPVGKKTKPVGRRDENKKKKKNKDTVCSGLQRNIPTSELGRLIFM